jgi:hypothetical protein
LILVGFLGVLARAPFCPSLLRYGSSERDNGRDGHNADEHKHHAATCSRSPWFHLASDRQSIVICGIFVGRTVLPFSKTSISKAWPALVNHEHHRGSAAVCARADALRHVVRGCALPRSNFRGMVALWPKGARI